MAADPDQRDRILDAALALLEKGGVAAVTTAALAREARCSKSTLYAAYRDRDAILAALIERQAETLNRTLDAALAPAGPEAGGPDARDALASAGAALLDLLTSDAALAINRAALADPSGGLSRILIAAGKARSAPRIAALLDRLRDEDVLGFGDTATVYRAFYGLLVSDRQILALHHVADARPGPEERRAVARAAVAGLQRLFPPA